MAKAVSIQDRVLKLIKTNLPKDKFEVKKTRVGVDIWLKSKDRAASKAKLESVFKKQDIKFKNAPRPKASQVLDLGIGISIIFKAEKVKGQGGRDFEGELKIDLMNYYNGSEEFKHPDVIKELEKVISIKPTDRTVVDDPGKNNMKRKMVFNDTSFVITHSTGKTVADLTLEKNKKDMLYLSLKMSSTYFIINGGVGQYFKDKATRKSAYEYFGLDGGANGMGLYGKDWVAQTAIPNYTKVKSNLEKLVSDAHGTDVVIVYKRKQNDVFVSQTTTKKAKVVVSGVDKTCYRYLNLNPKVPGERIRQYTNIEVEARINGVPVTLHFQFRDGTVAGVGGGPLYLRLMVDKH